MDISEEQFEIVFTKDCINEMDYIYSYISNNLNTPNSAKNLMRKVEETIQKLRFVPKAFGIIKRYDELDMEYRRIVISNYIILYTISEVDKKIYIVHMYYGGSNYLSKI